MFHIMHYVVFFLCRSNGSGTANHYERDLASVLFAILVLLFWKFLLFILRIPASIVAEQQTTMVRQ